MRIKALKQTVGDNAGAVSCQFSHGACTPRRYQEVAMGGGQQDIAVTLLHAAAQVSSAYPGSFVPLSVGHIEACDQASPVHIPFYILSARRFLILSMVYGR